MLANHYRMNVAMAEPVPFRPAPVETGFDAFGRDVAALFGILWRGKLWIAGTVCLFLAAALTFLVLATPLYLSKTQLLLDPRAKRVLQTEVVPTGLGSSSQGADTLLVDSQVEIIGSDAVLGRVIDKLGLAADPEFAKAPGSGLIQSLRETLAGGTAEERPQAQPAEAAMERLRRLLLVKRVGNTYVIEVSAFSRDRQKAARIANAVAEAYLADQASATSNSTRDTTEALTARLASLRQNVTEAEDRVEAYRRANNLVSTQGVLIDDQQLQDLNARLGVARARREEAQARFDQTQRLAQDGAGAASAADGLDSPVIAGLRSSLAELDRSKANLGAQLGPRHPEIRSLDAQRTIIQQQLNAELRLAIQRARSALDLARRNEATLSDNLGQLKRLSLGNNEAQVRMRELQRDADASRAVLESVLARAKQSSEQEDIATANFRVITPAAAAFRVTYPPSNLVLAGALVAGLAFGCLLAWLRDRFVVSKHAPEGFSA